FCERKLRRIAEHVDVTITGAARDIKIDSGAASGADGDPCPHRPSRACGGTHLGQHCASCRHGVVLQFFSPAGYGGVASSETERIGCRVAKPTAPSTPILFWLAIE